ncbi:methyltransferase domain-containing protein [Chitinophaga oryzae]|uniref:Methyltransferase domain-containing protein n=1 Tax=Chitinophaga oryzae TaxID=2725414 RepID=A0AAE7D960_9BACT|nr:methyltransferase domain-containing protein [Chitinophaga oryzae]QJB34098.1 methyltransferase domain-containing protein [Chitinophaga oryzae]QJB40617.1 methyltransferase domain-containing protein [Chitinophaga oryzae]
MQQSIYEVTNGEYKQKNPNWHIEDSAWKATQIISMLKRNNLSPKTITEIGCGAGEILHQLYQQLPSDTIFEGYEISPDAFALSSSRANERLSFYLSDMSALNTKSELLLVMDVFEHVEDYIGFIKDCKNKARYKMFHIPLDISVLALLRGTIMKTREKVGHLHYYTKETALATLRDNGYKIIDHFYTPSGVQLSRSFKSKIAKLPRILLYNLNKDFAVTLLGGHSLLVLAE